MVAMILHVVVSLAGSLQTVYLYAAHAARNNLIKYRAPLPGGKKVVAPIQLIGWPMANLFYTFLLMITITPAYSK